MKLCKKIFRIASLTFVILMLMSGTVLAAYSYYATVQVQETGGNPYDYLPVIADIDNNYLSANGYISPTGLDTRILSGSTELEHLVVDDKVLFIIPSVAANSTGNYRYTLGNSLLDDFPIITGLGGYITITDDADLELGNNFELEWKGYIDTTSGADKDLIYKKHSIRVYVSDTGDITASIFDYLAAYPQVEDTAVSTNSGTTSHTVNLPGSISAGNLLVVFFLGEDDFLITFPEGWTKLFEATQGTAITLAAGYRIADGGEGGSITVTTAEISNSANISYRITGHTGVPIVGTAATGNSDSPNPPNLVATWGAESNLWLVVAGWKQPENITSYSANYGTSHYSATAGVRLGAAQRELTAASDDPGVYTLAGTSEWVANTLVVEPDLVEVSTVTATGVSSGEHTVKVTYDGATLTIIVDEGEVGEITNTDSWVGSVFLNDFIWTLSQNNVMPYMEYYKHTVSDTLIAWYQPISMIIGTTLDDREGTDAGETGAAEEDATITWGTNPADLSATISSLISSSQPEIVPAGEDGAIDIVPEGEVPAAGGVVNVGKLDNNPLYFAVEIISEYTHYTEEQIWFIGATIIILIGMGIAVVKVPNHLLLAGAVGLVLGGFFMAMEIYSWWMMLIFGFMFVMTILMERKPTF